MKTEKALQHLQEMQPLDNESKKSISSFAEIVASGEISASILNEKWARTKNLLHIQIIVINSKTN